MKILSTVSEINEFITSGTGEVQIINPFTKNDMFITKIGNRIIMSDWSEKEFSEEKTNKIINYYKGL